jgi:hypothetical protein
VIADQSINYVERFIIDEGHTTQRLEADYGYDLILFTYDHQGYLEPGLAFLQLKAAESLDQSGGDYVFDLDIRDFHLWVTENYPVFLVLFDAGRRRAYWLHVQHYFQQATARQPKKGAKTIRVHVSKRHGINRRAVARMRQAKQAFFAAVEGGGKS